MTVFCCCYCEKVNFTRVHEYHLILYNIISDNWSSSEGSDSSDSSKAEEQFEELQNYNKEKNSNRKNGDENGDEKNIIILMNKTNLTTLFSVWFIICSEIKKKKKYFVMKNNKDK